MFGMWMFAFCTWNGARIIAHERVRMNAASNATKRWTLLDDDGNLVIVLIRKDQLDANVTVTVQLSGATAGWTENAIAPRLNSTSGSLWPASLGMAPLMACPYQPDLLWDRPRIVIPRYRRVCGL